MGEIRRAVRSTCKSMGSGLGSRPLRSSDIAVDSRGFGREIDSLPNDEDADAGSLGRISPARRAATARATLHVPNRRVTTLAAGHSPCGQPRRARLPRAGARACATSHTTTAADRSARASRASRRAPARASSAARSRPGWQRLAVRVGVALAVARLGVRAAAAAHPHVAGLDRPRLLAGRVLGA